MIKFFIRVFSFFLKEINDVKRQPRLLLSLVGGPLLVLAAFGATFRSANPFITTVLVWPENGIPGFSQEQAEKFVSGNFTLLTVTSDENEAMQWLEDGLVDVVQIIPEVSMEEGQITERPEIKVISKTIDPTAEAWIRSLAYGEKNIINQRLLGIQVTTAQDKATEISIELENAEGEFDAISLSVDPDEIKRVSGVIEDIKPFLIELDQLLPATVLSQANLSPELIAVHDNLDLLLDDISELEVALDNEELSPILERMGSISDEIGSLRGTIELFADTPSENILTPFQESYTNLRGSAYSIVVFYTPAVLAMLVQQLSITLASLGFVREKQMGTLEIFRVSPVKFSQILLGKALAYITYVTVAGVILTLLLRIIKVPLPINFGEHLLLLIVLTTASTGLGFLISATSKNDSQAIQLSMLVLLLSVFFTSFFLPITGFAWPAWIIALLLPMTHAIQGFQNLMLAGESVTLGVWIGLGLIILLSYGVVTIIMKRQFKKAVD